MCKWRPDSREELVVNWEISDKVLCMAQRPAYSAYNFTAKLFSGTVDSTKQVPRCLALVYRSSSSLNRLSILRHSLGSNAFSLLVSQSIPSLRYEASIALDCNFDHDPCKWRSDNRDDLPIHWALADNALCLSQKPQYKDYKIEAKFRSGAVDTSLSHPQCLSFRFFTSNPNNRLSLLRHSSGVFCYIQVGQSMPGISYEAAIAVDCSFDLDTCKWRPDNRDELPVDWQVDQQSLCLTQRAEFSRFQVTSKWKSGTVDSTRIGPKCVKFHYFSSGQGNKLAILHHSSGLVAMAWLVLPSLSTGVPHFPLDCDFARDACKWRVVNPELPVVWQHSQDSYCLQATPAYADFMILAKSSSAMVNVAQSSPKCLKFAVLLSSNVLNLSMLLCQDLRAPRFRAAQAIDCSFDGSTCEWKRNNLELPVFWQRTKQGHFCLAPALEYAQFNINAKTSSGMVDVALGNPQCITFSAMLSHPTLKISLLRHSEGLVCEKLRAPRYKASLSLDCTFDEGHSCKWRPENPELPVLWTVSQSHFCLSRSAEFSSFTIDAKAISGMVDVSAGVSRCLNGLVDVSNQPASCLKLSYLSSHPHLKLSLLRHSLGVRTGDLNGVLQGFCFSEGQALLAKFKASEAVDCNFDASLCKWRSASPDVLVDWALVDRALCLVATPEYTDYGIEAKFSSVLIDVTHGAPACMKFSYRSSQPNVKLAFLRHSLGLAASLAVDCSFDEDVCRWRSENQDLLVDWTRTEKALCMDASKAAGAYDLVAKFKSSLVDASNRAPKCLTLSYLVSHEACKLSILRHSIGSPPMKSYPAAVAVDCPFTDNTCQWRTENRDLLIDWTLLDGTLCLVATPTSSEYDIVAKFKSALVSVSEHAPQCLTFSYLHTVPQGKLKTSPFMIAKYRASVALDCGFEQDTCKWGPVERDALVDWRMKEGALCLVYPSESEYQSIDLLAKYSSGLVDTKASIPNVAPPMKRYPASRAINCDFDKDVCLWESESRHVLVDWELQNNALCFSSSAQVAQYDLTAKFSSGLVDVQEGLPQCIAFQTLSTHPNLRLSLLPGQELPLFRYKASSAIDCTFDKGTCRWAAEVRDTIVNWIASENALCLVSPQQYARFNVLAKFSSALVDISTEAPKKLGGIRLEPQAPPMIRYRASKSVDCTFDQGPCQWSPVNKDVLVQWEIVANSLCLKSANELSKFEISAKHESSLIDVSKGNPRCLKFLFSANHPKVQLSFLRHSLG
ncbi:hypothetical protein Ciccas_003726 [Cichlidogyrus casuarinus]|uniref:MAM domain-containing protein n=1 Tax=Cichlidogyrus casuarinus TaxID=1844966 RepID=A0ABD2QEE9_9PLAT